jgi:two-component system response regulator AtoC
MSGERILVIDDEKLIRLTLAEELGVLGYAVAGFGTAAEGRAAAAAAEYDLVLLDYRLPDGDGLEVLRDLVSRDADRPVILMTAYSSIETAVKAIKLGAFDYVNKPFEIDELAIRIAHGLERTALRREVRLHSSKLKEQHGIGRIIGASPAVDRLREQLLRIARSGASTVLVRGESGSGKDVFARALHYESDRARMPFVNVTCTAIPESLLESELFGHEKGAFTDAKTGKKGMFEMARGGTLFLDEIGDMPPVLQAKLLRFLEERSFRRVGGTEDISVDVRIVAATNRDLEDAVKAGAFRADLYYRLKVIQIDVPPLRDREDDVARIAQAFADQLAAELKKRRRTLSREALALLRAYPWPGNVRELRNAVERAMILGVSEEILPEDLPAEIRAGAAPADARGRYSLPPEGIKLEDVENDLVRQALERANGNQSAAARFLDISRDQLRYRMERMGLLPPPPKRAKREAAD